MNYVMLIDTRIQTVSIFFFLSAELIMELILMINIQMLAISHDWGPYMSVKPNILKKKKKQREVERSELKKWRAF